MSAVGHFGENAACKGSLGSLKRERVYRTKHPKCSKGRRA